MTVARIECTAFEEPILTNSTDELLKLVAEALPMLDPNSPGNCRISIYLEHIDPEEFEKLPNL